MAKDPSAPTELDDDDLDAVAGGINGAPSAPTTAPTRPGGLGGADFSGVGLHGGSGGAGMGGAAGMGGGAELNIASRPDLESLRHEATHTVQGKSKG